MKVFLVAGARPNFMKIAPIYRAAKQFLGVDVRIVHTGQHYDEQMSRAFFRDLDLPEPDYFLDAGSGSHAVQTAKIMVEFERVCLEGEPDLVMVVGDVNSTLACSLVAKKMGVRVAHVEAGLRSRDLAMPEEINRLVTDAISDHFFVTEESGAENLLAEGKNPASIHRVGHVMIDNLLHQVNILETMDLDTFHTFGLKQCLKRYGFVTLHRPSNVDEQQVFEEIASALNVISDHIPLIFPVHPRTRKRMDRFGIELSPQIFQLPALSFKESLFLWKDAEFVLTDSGGLQEETTALRIPCLTVRNNTERPVTVSVGSNTLAGNTREGILDAFARLMTLEKKRFGIPDLWDGKAAERIWEVLTML